MYIMLALCISYAIASFNLWMSHVNYDTFVMVVSFIDNCPKETFDRCFRVVTNILTKNGYKKKRLWKTPSKNSFKTTKSIHILSKIPIELTIKLTIKLLTKVLPNITKLVIKLHIL